MDAIYITRCPFLEHPGNRHQTHYSNAVAVGCIMKAKEAHPMRYAVVPIPCQYRKGLNARRFGDRIFGLYAPVDRRTCRRARSRAWALPELIALYSVQKRFKRSPIWRSYFWAVFSADRRPLQARAALPVLPFSARRTFARRGGKEKGRGSRGCGERAANAT